MKPISVIIVTMTFVFGTAGQEVQKPFFKVDCTGNGPELCKWKDPLWKECTRNPCKDWIPNPCPGLLHPLCCWWSAEKIREQIRCHKHLINLTIMVLLGGLELLAGAYLINEHKKHKKEKVRIQEEQASNQVSRPRPSRRLSDSPQRQKLHLEHRKYRSKSPTRYEVSAKRRPHYDQPSNAKPTAAIVPPSYYHPCPHKAQSSSMSPYHKPFPAPPTHFAPPPTTHSSQAIESPSPPASSVSLMRPEYQPHAPFDVSDGFSPEQRQYQPMYASNYASIQYPDHLAELGDPSLTGEREPQFQYDDGLMYDERRNRHVRFAIPRNGDETQLEVVHPRNVPPPPYSP